MATNSEFNQEGPDSSEQLGQTMGVGARSNAQQASGVGYEVLSWPPNLGETRYPHFMMFYINVNGKSKIAKENAGKLDNIDMSKRPGNAVTTAINNAQSASQSELAAKTTEVLNSSGNGILDTFKNELKPDRFLNSYKRLRTAVVLPIPHNLSTNYGATYNEAQAGIAGSFIKDVLSGQAMQGTAKALSSVAQSLPKAALAGIGSGIGGIVAKSTGRSSIAGQIGGAIYGHAVSQDFQNLTAKLSGLAVNNRAEQVFQNIQTRQFQFDYLLAPQSEEETITIKSIIDTFKYHMHPELNTENLAADNFLVMPSEFDIEFRYKKEENNNIAKISTCVLTDVRVNYTPTNSWQAFSGTGNPPLIGLSLVFREIEPLTAEMIKKGY